MMTSLRSCDYWGSMVALVWSDTSLILKFRIELFLYRVCANGDDNTF